MTTPAQLKKIMPQLGARCALVAPILDKAMAEFSISVKLRPIYFLTQLAHESAGLTLLEENLNYSASGLANTWPSRYAEKSPIGVYLISTDRKKLPNQLAILLQRKPIAIANNCYSNRVGNGDEASGDGWRFRGAGGIQLTFRNNHVACALHFGIPLDQIGDWLRTFEGACRSAAWFWWRCGCNSLADQSNFDAISDLINLGHRTAAVGDAIGYADRLNLLAASRQALA